MFDDRRCPLVNKTFCSLDTNFLYMTLFFLMHNQQEYNFKTEGVIFLVTINAANLLVPEEVILFHR